jgi:hypothetical protein
LPVAAVCFEANRSRLRGLLLFTTKSRPSGLLP